MNIMPNQNNNNSNNKNNNNNIKASEDGPSWVVHASTGALNTSNPIREIIETMDLAENPEKKVIPLSIGDPTIFGNLKPCKEILDALDNANSSGKYYGYQTAAGMESAREAVANYQSKCTGTEVKKQDVILASGCSHAIDLCICVLAKAGQNILIPRPGFPLYKTLTSVYGVNFKQYNLIAEKNWSIDLRHLESLIDENTAAIVINNPSNPCGSVFSRKHLMQILGLAEKYQKPIIADEIYDKFVFSPKCYNNKQQESVDKARCQRYVNDTANIRQQFQMIESRNPPLESACDTFGSDAEETSADYLASDESNGDYEEDEEDIMIEDELIAEPIRYNNGNNLSRDDELDEGADEGDNEDEGQSEAEDEDEDEEDGVQDDDITYIPFRALSSLSKVVPILTCGGISKTCLIPGLRLGWIIIHDPLGIFDHSVRNGLNRLTQRLMGPNSLVQGALADILTSVPESFYSQTMDFIFKNAKLCYDRLRLVKGLHPFMPQGSMYLMVRFDPKSFPDIQGDLDFTSKLMNEESVLVLPGRCFDFPNYFRICLTVPTNVMEKALDRMSDFCERHHIDTDNDEYNYASLINNYNKDRITTTTTTTLQLEENINQKSENNMIKLCSSNHLTSQQEANKCK